MAFAAIMGAARRAIPYANHRLKPKMCVASMSHDRSSAERVRQVFTTCGTNDPVAKIAAT